MLIKLDSLNSSQSLVGIEKRRNRDDDLVDRTARLLFSEFTKVVDDVGSNLLRIDHRFLSLDDEFVPRSVLLSLDNCEWPKRNEILNNRIIEILRHNTLRFVNRVRLPHNLLLLSCRSH